MRSLQLAVVVAGGFLTACIEEPPNESSSGHSVETHNRLIGNRLIGNRLVGNHLAAGRLASQRLSGTTLVLDEESAGPILATEEGRDVLSYIISCAVPAGTVLTVANPGPGEPTEYFGSLGLAPDWLDRPLDGVGKGWVSACLFARVNANAEAVAISLRGATPALDATPDEEAEYVLQEGAFYGNYFTALDKPIEWFSCRGRDQAAGETGSLADRDCAEPSATDPNVSVCGFNFQGDCFGAEAACESEHDGLFSRCDTSLDDDDDDDGPAHGHGHSHGRHNGWWRGHGHGHGYGHGHHGHHGHPGHQGHDEDSRQVITVYVTAD